MFGILRNTLRQEDGPQNAVRCARKQRFELSHSASSIFLIICANFDVHMLMHVNSQWLYYAKNTLFFSFLFLCALTLSFLFFCVLSVLMFVLSNLAAQRMEPLVDDNTIGFSCIVQCSSIASVISSRRISWAMWTRKSFNCISFTC